ncbi:protein SYM1 isoform X5 [Elaeis guineensis]|uniref:protein SYM1 isoform X5 n=1 Tax=Elaeis guineensis var. tenera TaxID=51953 RepID=UPI003C6D92DA
MLKLWRWYRNCLAVHPVKTQMISSGFLWGLGDIGAQTVTHSTLRKQHQLTMLPFSSFNERWDSSSCRKIKSSKSIGKGWLSQVRLDLHMMDQLATTGTSLSISQIYTNLLRVFFTGFLPLYRYEYLDYYIRVRLQLQPKSFKFVTAKVAADGLLCGPLDLLIFFSYMGFASGKSMDQVKEDVKKDFLPALLVEAGVWPFVQVANFRFVPVRYQLLYVNFFCLLDSTFLSWIEQQADAPWKKWFAPIVTLEDQKGQA